jgi:uncharacterized protein (TIGR02271 family)
MRKEATMPTETMTVERYAGRTLLDSRDEKIGTIEDVYFDEDTREPEWFLINTGLFGLQHSFVPVTGTRMRGDAVCVPFDKALVKEAPRIAANREIERDEESRLYDHYGLGYADSPPTSQPPRGKPQPPATGWKRTDSAMTRSEEELKVGKGRRPSELVRLKKRVVTEPVTTTVPVQHEEIRVEREPITDANIDRALAGPDIRENVHEETLMEEQVVTGKRVVPKERVRLAKDTVTEQEQVSGRLRKEQIDVERDRKL